MIASLFPLWIGVARVSNLVNVLIAREVRLEPVWVLIPKKPKPVQVLIRAVCCIWGFQGFENVHGMLIRFIRLFDARA